MSIVASRIATSRELSRRLYNATHLMRRPKELLMRIIGMLLVLPVAFLFGQQRFGGDYPKLKGITKSPTEHIINQYEGVSELREMRGQVVDSSGASIRGALFEIRSYKSDGRNSGGKMKQDGSFHMSTLKDGKHVFKVTKDGFQSVFGEIRVNGKAPKNNLKTKLQVGV